MHDKIRIEEQFTDRVISEELLSSCRNHIESLQNLSYLTLSEAAEPNQVRLHVNMMEWHLRNLTEVLVRPLRHLSKVPADSSPAKPQMFPITTVAESNEAMHVSCEGEFRTAPARTIWPALLNVADDARLHRLSVKAHRMMTTARGSTSSKASLPNAVSDWMDFSAAVEDEENRRLLTH